MGWDDIERNFNQINIKADGNCFYRCLSMYFTRNEESYNKIRLEICNFRKENNNIFPIDENPVTSINDYLDYHSQNNIWAEDSIIQIAPELYQCQKHI